MADTFDKLLWELERCWTSTTRRQVTDEFKQEAVGFLAIRGRPLRQIARELGIAASMLRVWRDAGGRGNAGPPRRSNTQAAAPYSGTDLASENARLQRENDACIWSGKMFFLCNGAGGVERLHRRLAEAPASLMWPRLIVLVASRHRSRISGSG